MKNYTYIGPEHFLMGHTALGRVDCHGVFRVQVDSFNHPYSHGWNRSNRARWERTDGEEEAQEIAKVVETIEIRSSKGGFVGHWFTGGKAACGYSPSSPNGHLIRGRAGWRDTQRVPVADALEGGFRWCPKCLTKYQKSLDLPLV